VLPHTPPVRGRELAGAGDASSFTDAVVALFGLELPTDAPQLGEADDQLDRRA